MRASHLWAILTIGALAGCGIGEPRPLHDLRSFDRQPEEFSIVPNKPLQSPESLAALPEPTPGGANRADQTPLADAVAALGGNPARLNADGVPSSDGALINRAGRFGREADVRATLAAEDEAFRDRGGRFTWKLFPEDQYSRVYRRQSLDSWRWLRSSRSAGARTPTAPPEN
jgi:hypothetical protein